MDLTVLYRGPLASCDYDCPYCPFAKRRDTTAQLRADRAALERFAHWATHSEDQLSLLFTPWGEGLVRSWYRRTLTELSHLPHIRRVAIQTNLSCRTDWLTEADLDTIALWCTYHPGQTPYDRFLAKCRDLAEREVRFSVGVVGLPDTWRRLDGYAPICPDTSTCGSTPPRATPTGTARPASGPRSIPSSRTAVTRTRAPACPAAPASP